MDAPLAVCSWSLQPSGPDELLADLDAVGIPAIQLALDPVVNDPDVWGTTVSRLRDAGITIVSGMMGMAGEDYTTLETIRSSGGVRPDATWPANLVHATRIAETAAEAAIPLVTFHAGFIPDEPDDPERAKLIDRLHLVADAFEPRGIRLGLETGQETAATLEVLLSKLDRPVFEVNFDPANMILYGMGDPVEAVKILAHSIGQVHIKDATPTDTPGTWGTEVPVGTGAVDWSTFFAVLRREATPTACVIEREAGEQRVADVRTAGDVVRPLMETGA
ncbi:MAG: sugar phosphate isomerase/epimerase family protein [Planctomycetota bacterium]|jgi:sugar phosphate isomerase/epimerase